MEEEKQEEKEREEAYIAGPMNPTSRVQLFISSTRETLPTPPPSTPHFDLLLKTNEYVTL